MKRRTELKAKKGLERRTGLSRTSELNNGSDLKRKKPIRQQSRKERAKRRSWEQYRQDVYARVDGMCDMCGKWIAWCDYECHHRRLRSQGGRNEMANLIALHKFPCHARAHNNRTWARRNGFIVHRPDVPGRRPVFRHERSWQLPGETWTPSAPPKEVAA